LASLSSSAPLQPPPRRRWPRRTPLGACVSRSCGSPSGGRCPGRCPGRCRGPSLVRPPYRPQEGGIRSGHGQGGRSGWRPRIPLQRGSPEGTDATGRHRSASSGRLWREPVTVPCRTTLPLPTRCPGDRERAKARRRSVAAGPGPSWFRWRARIRWPSPGERPAEGACHAACRSMPSRADPPMAVKQVTARQDAVVRARTGRCPDPRPR
jgi:hypothetical protein